MNAHARALIVLTLLSLGGCASAGLGEADENESGARHERGAFVLTGAALTDGPGSVLATMLGKVPNLRVQRLSTACPIVTLRNAVSFQSVVAPLVYVDGTHATDTCVLESLRAVDVARIEVYPQGFTTRPGYATHAHGLILIFMRSAGGA
ncbi:MAG TPA: hypothetical protein VJ997_11460 [Longimicrobiales bacterium]|nr:hypothetical protein [Longimicrobiales bacterium]